MISDNLQRLQDSHERIKTNIERAYSKCEEKGAVLPVVQSSDNLAETIGSIEQGSSEWKPQEDWFDIDKILAEDTEDFAGKMICLLKDSKDVLRLNGVYRCNKIKTSDGAEYTEFSNGVTHIWDKSKDKSCALGYKTRYIIFYWSNKTNFASDSFEYINETLYMIWSGMRIYANNTGYQIPELRICECFKMKDCVYEAESFQINNKSIYDVVIENTSFLNITNLSRAFSGTNLSSDKIKELYSLISNGNETYCGDTFSNDINLKSIVLKGTSNCTAMNGMFNACYNLIFVNNLDTRKSSNCASMFNNCCRLLKLGDLNLNDCTTMSRMFYECFSLSRVGNLMTTNVKIMDNLFYNCVSLKKIEGMDFNSVTNVNNMFSGCSSLTNIERIYNIKVSGLSFSSCVVLNRETLLRIIDALHDFSTDAEGTHTITFGSTNLAKLSDEELAIGQNKGWTIS